MSYLEHFHLGEEPFADNAPLRFFYADPKRQQLLDVLSHVTEFSDEVHIILGEQGVGKSAFTDYLMENSDNAWRTCEIRGASGLDTLTLLQKIIDGFDLSFGEETLTLTDFEKKIAEFKSVGLKPVLIVDDADLLSADAINVLQMLGSKRDDEGSPILNILLLAKPALEPRLQEHEENLKFLHLEPLTELQTAEYLKHRLAVAGFEGEAPFSPTDVQQIHEQSGGYPEKINLLATSFLKQQSGDLSEFDVEELDLGSEEEDLPAESLVDELEERLIADDSGPSADDDFELEPEKRGISGTTLAIGAVVASALVALIVMNPFGIGQQDVDEELVTVEINNKPIATLPLALPPETSESDEESAAQQSASASDAFNKQQSPRNSESTPAISDSTISVTNDSDKVVKSIPLTVAGQPVDSLAKPATDTPKAPATQLTPRKEDVADVKSSADDKLDIVQPQAEQGATQELKAESAEAKTLPPLRITQVSPEPVIGSNSRQTLTISGSGFDKDTRAQLLWGKNSKLFTVEDQQQFTVESDSVIKMRITTGTNPQQWQLVLSRGEKETNPYQFRVVKPAKAVVAQKTQSAAKAIEPKADSSELQDERWIKQQIPGYYTLQLLGTSYRANIEQLVKEHNLTGNMAVYEVIRNGQPWYSLIYGRYSSKAKASAAVGSLPKGLSSAKPWIRTYGSIQSQLDKVQKQQSKPDPVSQNQTISGLDDKAWLWAQSPSAYTLQLLGAQSENSVREFMQTHELSGKAIYIKTLREGSPWYVLIMGSYPDRDSALNAIKALPGDVQKAGPWARPFSAIHALIKE